MLLFVAIQAGEGMALRAVCIPLQAVGSLVEVDFALRVTAVLELLVLSYIRLCEIAPIPLG